MTSPPPVSAGEAATQRPLGSFQARFPVRAFTASSVPEFVAR